jgi:hypothetical protein
MSARDRLTIVRPAKIMNTPPEDSTRFPIVLVLTVIAINAIISICLVLFSPVIVGGLRTCEALLR